MNRFISTLAALLILVMATLLHPVASKKQYFNHRRAVEIDDAAAGTGMASSNMMMMDRLRGNEPKQVYSENSVFNDGQEEAAGDVDYVRVLGGGGKGSKGDDDDDDGKGKGSKGDDDDDRRGGVVAPGSDFDQDTVYDGSGGAIEVDYGVQKDVQPPARDDQAGSLRMLLKQGSEVQVADFDDMLEAVELENGVVEDEDLVIEFGQSHELLRRK